MPQHHPTPGELQPTPDHELITCHTTYKKAPKWSFPGKLSGVKPSGTEVGHYSADDKHRDINGRYKRDPSWSMRSPKDFRSSSVPPGPGRYSSRDGLLRFTAPSWGFGSSSKQAEKWILDGSVGPGPAAYAPDHGVVFKGSPAYSTAGRGKDKSRSLGPGPGYYGPPRSTLKGKVGRWGDAPHLRPNSAPFDDTNSRSPGPNYMPGDGANGPQYSMGARREAAKMMMGRLPGPRTQFGY
mmetsp:Transcript_5688/g.10177  ORF Transcript_5688/g.10177 Transcript_5688/m.10177 type:complete len:239 (+) Transcript_5688:45-761(+)